MAEFPDFSKYGYQIKSELGRNVAGGRITYLAKRILNQNLSTIQDNSENWVVIKQFQFATTSANWSDFKAHEREIQVLESLDHPGIPKYLDSFETPTGFCMVQEYKEANYLGMLRSFEPEQIKQIALYLLEILVYLQILNPLVIHRDIKPENILVAEDAAGSLKVYLVDFGFAQMGGGEVAMSSMVKGTLGFMAPEQLFNRTLTPASDLYGLGASLICLLTATKSMEVGKLLDENYHFEFRELLPKLSRRWISWLEKMVEPDPRNRYANAAEALAALQPIYVNRTPEVKLSPSSIELTAPKVGDKLQVQIVVKNSVPETLLTGWWEVAPHPSDRPQLGQAWEHSPYKTEGDREKPAHPWISFSPSKFADNRVVCEILINTRKLRTGQVYDRQLLLHTNAVPDTQTVSLTVQTAPVPIAVRKLPYRFLGLLFLVAAGGSVVALESMMTLVTVAIAGFGTWAGLARILGSRNHWLKMLVAFLTTMVVAGIAGFGIGVALGATATGLWTTAIAAAVTVATTATLLATATGVRKNFGTGWAIAISLVTAICGITFGLGLKLQLLASPWLLALATTAPVLALILILPASDRRRLAKYRQSEQHLIES
jgi:serine/threonine protein kinase